MVERLKNNKKAIIILILLLITVSVGISYAYWRLTLQQTGENKIASSCLSIELVEESEFIRMEKAYPILDEEGMQTTPYTFTIRNTCDTFIDYEVSLGMLDTTTLKSEYVAAVLDYNEIKTLNTYEETTIDGYKEGRILQKGSLSQGDEVSYNLRLWMDEDVTIENTGSMNQTFEAKVVVTAAIGSYSPVEQGFTTLADAMLVNEYQLSSLEDAKEMIASKQAPDFTKTAPIIDWQESHASNQTTVTATMPHPDLVGTGGIAANLTETNILPRIGTSYEFNSETGRYTVTGDLQYVDPTTLDYSNDYYCCDSGFNTNVSDLISPYGNYANCTKIYKITSATKEEGTTTGNGGTEIKTRIYRLSGYAYNQSERESDKSDRGLYTMEDDYGTSYYYRGSVTNNYVYFGGYYWRIIRLNGNGSIRLLYAGETSDATGNNLNMKLTDSSLGYTNRTTSPFNNQRTNPGHVGYMYGSTFNSTYEETNANENDSDIKKYLDSWYKQNIEDKGLSEYIADSGFCNDRSLSSRANNGDGVQSSGTHTYYAGYTRYYETHSPILTCPNVSNDLFTTSTSETGNKALTYPIGLITVDELMLGGLSGDNLNRLSYTYSSSSYWTLSPVHFYVTYTSANEFYANSVGFAGSHWVTLSFGVRAVINLKSDVQISGGIGTANDPFVVQTT